MLFMFVNLLQMILFGFNTGFYRRSDLSVGEKIDRAGAPALGASCRLGRALHWELTDAAQGRMQTTLVGATNSAMEIQGFLIQIRMGRRCDGPSKSFSLFSQATYWILSSTTPGFAVSSPLSTNQCCSLVAIVRSSFLLLQVCCIIAKSEKNNTSLEIWLVKMICKIITMLSPSPVSCGTLLMPQVNGKSMVTNKSNLEMDVLIHVLSHLHHHPDDTPKLSMISSSGYANLDLYQIYMEIIESKSWSIGLAARSLNIFNWNHLSCVNQWSKVSIIVTFLQHYYVHTQQSSINGSPICPIEQAYLTSYCCTRSPFIDGIYVEDTVPGLFGLCHRRWTIAPSLLILRFNSRDSLSLSSVKAIRYLRLNAHKLKCIRQKDRWESQPWGINWYGAQGRPLKIAIAASSSPSCRRTNDRCLTPFAVFGIFYANRVI